MSKITEEISILQQNLHEIHQKTKIFHKDIFGFHLKRFFPFSVLFGRPDYEGMARGLQILHKALLQQSKYCQKRKNDLPFFFSSSQRYIDSFALSITYLKQCAELLELQGLGNKDFSLKKWNAQTKQYQSQVEDYIEKAREANAIWQQEKQSIH